MPETQLFAKYNNILTATENIKMFWNRQITINLIAFYKWNFLVIGNDTISIEPGCKKNFQ